MPRCRTPAAGQDTGGTGDARPRTGSSLISAREDDGIRLINSCRTPSFPTRTFARRCALFFFFDADGTIVKRGFCFAISFAALSEDLLHQLPKADDLSHLSLIQTKDDNRDGVLPSFWGKRDTSRFNFPSAMPRDRVNHVDRCVRGGFLIDAQAFCGNKGCVDTRRICRYNFRRIVCPSLPLCFDVSRFFHPPSHGDDLSRPQKPRTCIHRSYNNVIARRATETRSWKNFGGIGAAGYNENNSPCDALSADYFIP